MLTKNGLMINKKMPPLYRNWNIMLFLKILQKHRVTLEDIHPPTMGMNSYHHGTGLGVEIYCKDSESHFLFIYCCHRVF